MQESLLTSVSAYMCNFCVLRSYFLPRERKLAFMKTAIKLIKGAMHAL